MKHGYTPTIGIRTHIMRPTSQPYRSYRLGFYWFMIEWCGRELSLFYGGRLKWAVIFPNRTWKIPPKITVWNGLLRWSIDAEIDWKNDKITYSWKKENSKHW